MSVRDRTLPFLEESLMTDPGLLECVGVTTLFFLRILPFWGVDALLDGAACAVGDKVDCTGVGCTVCGSVCGTVGGMVGRTVSGPVCGLVCGNGHVTP